MNCKAENSIMVGNKSEIDIIGAVNAGMSAILVNSDDSHMITKKHWIILILRLSII